MRKQNYENQMQEELDSENSCEKNKKPKKRKLKIVDEKTNDCLDPRKLT